MKAQAPINKTENNRVVEELIQIILFMSIFSAVFYSLNHFVNI